MRIVYGGSIAGCSNPDGQISQEQRKPPQSIENPQIKTGKSVRRISRINGERIRFRDLALMAWPQKAEANLSFLTGYDARTCRRWLAGDTEPPAEALGVILAEIMRRFHQRD